MMLDHSEAAWEWHGASHSGKDGIEHYRHVKQVFNNGVDRIFTVGDFIVLNCGEDNRDQNPWIAQLVDLLDQEPSDSDLEESPYAAMGIIVRWFFHKSEVSDASKDKYLPKDAGLKKNEYMISDMIETAENNTVDAIVGRAHIFQTEGEFKQFQDRTRLQLDIALYSTDLDKTILCRWFYALRATNVSNPPRIRKLNPGELVQVSEQPSYEPLFEKGLSPKKKPSPSPKGSKLNRVLAAGSAPPPPSSPTAKKAFVTGPEELFQVANLENDDGPIVQALLQKEPDASKLSPADIVAGDPSTAAAVQQSQLGSRKRKAAPSKLADPVRQEKKPKSSTPQPTAPPAKHVQIGRTAKAVKKAQGIKILSGSDTPPAEKATHASKRTVDDKGVAAGKGVYSVKSSPVSMAQNETRNSSPPGSAAQPAESGLRRILGSEGQAHWLRSLDHTLQAMTVAATKNQLPVIWQTLMQIVRSYTDGRLQHDTSRSYDHNFVEQLKRRGEAEFEAAINANPELLSKRRSKTISESPTDHVGLRNS